MNIYFDAAATTQVDYEVCNAMLPYFVDKYYNPSSLYSQSKDIKRDIDNARSIIAKSINAKNDEIYFTSGGSESNCWAIQGFCKKHKKAAVITSRLEHHSIIECCKDLPSSNLVLFTNVNKDGMIDLDTLNIQLSRWRTCYSIIVSVQLANNEIGTRQNIRSISRIVHRYNAILHCDATQAYCHIPIDVEDLGIDMLTISGHKINAPKGIGFLYIKNGIDISPIIYGSQENGMRGGTENVPYIIGLAKAVEIHQKYNNALYHKAMLEVQNYLMTQLTSHFDCKINGSLTKRLDNNVNVTFNSNVTGEGLIYLLNTTNILISAGSACNSNNNEPSQVLKAIGLSDSEALKTIRITIPDLRIQAFGSLIEIKSEDEYNYIVRLAKENIDLLITELDKALRIFNSKKEES